MSTFFLSALSTIQKTSWQERVLFVFIFALCIVNGIWVHQDHAPLLWDIAGHSYRSAQYAEFIRYGHIWSLLTFDTIYPPFIYVYTGGLFLLFGYHWDLPQYSQLFFIVLFACSLFFITSTLTKSKTIALFSVVIALLSPQMAHFSRIFDLDFQQAAMITATLASLIYTKNFERKNASVLFGAVLACTFLTKWTSVLFIIGPVAIALWEAVIKNKERSMRIKNILIAASVTFILCIPWYGIHALDIARSSVATRNNGFSVPYENLLGMGNILFYAKSAWNGMTPIVFIGGVIGFIILGYKKNYRALVFLLSWIFVPWFLMTFVLYSKETRYFLSSVPALAVGAGVLFDAIKKTDQKDSFHALRSYIFSILGTCLIVLLAIAWTETTWNVRILPQQVQQALGLSRVYGYTPISTQAPGWGTTYPQYSFQDPSLRIAGSIRADIQMRIQEDYEATPLSLSHPVSIIVVPNSASLTAQQIQYAGVATGLISEPKPWAIDFAASSRVRGTDWKEELENANYIVTKTGDQGPKVWGPSLTAVRDEEKKSDSAIFSHFTLIDSFTISGFEPGNQTIRIYRNR